MPNLLVLSGLEEPKTHYVHGFPWPEFHGDTWRKKEYYDSFWEHYEDKDMEKAMLDIKRAHADFSISMKPERNKSRKYGYLTVEHIVSKSSDRCLSCNSPLWYGRCHNSKPDLLKDGFQQPSLDRLNPNLGRNEIHQGYFDGNVWIICKKCNTRKNDASSPDELINLAEAWKLEIERNNGSKTIY